MIVYMPLLNEGANCWRPVAAEQVGSDTYRILEKRPEKETWPVSTGDIVRCEPRKFADGLDGLVVVVPDTDLPPPIS